MRARSHTRNGALQAKPAAVELRNMQNGLLGHPQERHQIFVSRRLVELLLQVRFHVRQSSVRERVADVVNSNLAGFDDL